MSQNCQHQIWESINLPSGAFLRFIFTCDLLLCLHYQGKHRPIRQSWIRSPSTTVTWRASSTNLFALSKRKCQVSRTALVPHFLRELSLSSHLCHQNIGFSSTRQCHSCLATHSQPYRLAKRVAAVLWYITSLFVINLKWRIIVMV